MRHELNRRMTNKHRLLTYLQQHGTATNVELAQVAGMRYGGRVWELQREGWDITVEHEAGGLWRIRYFGKRQPGQMPLLEAVGA